MSKIAAELVFGNLPSYHHGTEPYTASAVGLGLAMMQKNGGAPLGNWAGPIPPAVIRPFEYTTATIASFPWAMTWPSSSTDWVFFGDNLTAAATRKILYATMNRDNGTFGIQGIAIVTFPVATNITVKGFGMEYYPITTGTISIPSGSITVTGSGTQWSSQGACIGNRIGFGSVIPSAITQWYEITGSSAALVTSSLGLANTTSLNNAFLTLTTPAAQSYVSQPYIIEDLRCIMCTSNATPTNGDCL